MSRRRVALLVSALIVASLPFPTAAAKPPNPGGKPAPPASTTLSWSGYDWSVKQHSRKIGPGPNFFAAANARVVGDALHLSITRSGNRWYAAEVINTRSLGYGTYAWQVRATPDLDPNVVLGLFTWNDDPAFNHREIDVEYAKWGNAADPNNAQYVVQPYSTAGNEHRWARSVFGESLVQSFTWTPTSVVFRTTTASGAPVHSWTYTGPDVPQAGGENARMNLWLFRGSAPQNGQPVTVVLERFTHTPLSGG